MTYPSQTIRVLDPGIGFVDVAGDSPFKFGFSTGGTAAAGQLIAVSQPNAVRAALGFGDLADDVAKTLNERGGPVLCMKGAGSTAAVNSAVTKVGVGTPTPTITGTATMRISAQIRVKVGGPLGTAQFDYTLDNWAPTVVEPTRSTQRVVPSGGTFGIPNSGITVTFPAGTYVKDDYYTFTCEPAHLNASDVGNVFLAALAQAGFNPKIWHCTDSYTTATEAGAVATAFGTQMQGAAAAFRFGGGFIDLGSADTTTNAKTARASISDTRIATCYGYDLTAAILPFEGYGYRYSSCAGSLSARAARLIPSSALSRFSEGSLGGTKWVSFDGNNDATVDAAGISTLKSYAGAGAAYYPGNGLMAAPPGSDFQKWQYRRLMDIACSAAYFAMLPYLDDDVRTNADGTIHTKDADQIDTALGEAMAAALLRPLNARGRPGLVSAVGSRVDRTNNVNATSELITNIGIRPRGYASLITQNIGYSINVVGA
jgi:hypothetical protein